MGRAHFAYFAIPAKATSPHPGPGATASKMAPMRVGIIGRRGESYVEDVSAGIEASKPVRL